MGPGFRVKIFSAVLCMVRIALELFRCVAFNRTRYSFSSGISGIQNSIVPMKKI